jgi:hypothetical protein
MLPDLSLATPARNGYDAEDPHVLLKYHIPTTNSQPRTVDDTASIENNAWATICEARSYRTSFDLYRGAAPGVALCEILNSK